MVAEVERIIPDRFKTNKVWPKYIVIREVEN